MDTMGAGAEWKLFGTGPAIVDAFKKRELDMAYIGLPPAIIGTFANLDDSAGFLGAFALA